MQYVLDTHALIWYLTANPRLSAAAKSAFDEIDAGKAIGIVSVMVLAEIVLLEEKKARRSIFWTSFQHCRKAVILKLPTLRWAM